MFERRVGLSMEDFIKKLRILAIQEDKNREKAAHYLRIIENELSYALYRIYGKKPDTTHSKLVVHQDEGLVFIYDYSDSPDKEGFVFEKRKGFEKQYERLSEETGERFWVGIETVINWIPATIASIIEEEKTKQAIISQLEKITASVKDKYTTVDKDVSSQKE